MHTNSNEALPKRPANKQELYEAIRRTSKDAFILEDMKRLGFWEKSKDQPSIAEQLVQRETQLQKELNALITEKRRVEDKEALLQQLRKERMAESKRKRAENKLKRIEAEKQKKETWKARQATDIVYLGEGVSGGLQNHLAVSEKLIVPTLPVFAKPLDLAIAMNLTLSQLRFIAFHRSISKVSHYRRFSIAKKSGGSRKISVPMYKLKDVQYWILENILNKIPVHDAAHGFRASRSIVTNATPHVQAAVVGNFDLKDFFPSITYTRVKGLFGKMGYPEPVATVLALLCTEPDTDEAELDGEKWYIGNGERHLPQGAPCSPAITNNICYKLDIRLTGLAKKLGFTYTRYADDLTFSSSNTHCINSLTQWVTKIVTDEGFELHPDKTKIMRPGAKKEVTGIVVNEGLNVNRKTRKKFRAALHQIETKGAANVHWGKSPSVIASLEGYANFLLMVNRETGGHFKEKLTKLMPVIYQSHQRIPKKTYPKRIPFTDPKPMPQTPEIAQPVRATKKPWWKFW